MFALFALTFWFPNDIKGGFLETTIAGKSAPGDAFFPVILAILIAVLAAVQVLQGVLLRLGGETSTNAQYITLDNLKFLSVLAVIVGICLALMYWLGPFVVALSGQEATYRQLIDTVPFKYVGFAVGGGFLTCTLIFWAEGKASMRAVLVSLVLIAVLILVFDVALNNVQLPPNSDY
ncbi:hypothetical protein [Roseovarius sp. 2305UL8-3]|uniref:hypothetical protein n=1 Tax=Roseovarius conchicola TaxID=3121636 RepID=UPI003526EDA7